MLGDKTQAETIEEVIEIMDDIVDDAILRPDRLGYFAALYRTVTRVVKERCDESDLFEDDDRMRRLDVIFANRYFDAYFDHREQAGRATGSWAASFECTPKTNLLILQHLLLGMNAHIALDLGIAAAQAAHEYDGMTESLKRDFMRLNNLLGSLIDTVQVEVCKLSPLLRYADMLAWRGDETFVSFSINIARDRAWDFAESLYALPHEEWDQAIQARDAQVSRFARRVLGGNPWYLVPFIWLIGLSESRDVRRNVTVLSSESWQSAIRNRLSDVLAKVKQEGVDLSKRSTQTVHMANPEKVEERIDPAAVDPARHTIVTKAIEEPVEEHLVD